MELRSKELYSDRGILRYTGGSLVLHVVLFGLMAFSNYFIIRPHFEKVKEVNLKLAQASVRVDVVAMPRMTVKELKVLEAMGGGPKEEILEIKEAPAPTPDTGKEFLKKKKKIDLKSMLGQLSQRKVEKAKRVKKKKVVKKKKKKRTSGQGIGISSSMSRKLNQMVIAGNKLSKGTALVGSGLSAEELGVLEGYIVSLPEHVRPFWKLPTYLKTKELTCRIRIYLSPDGNLINATIYQSSGDEEYDQRALKSVYNSAPFPVLPEEIKSSAARGNILLGFPL